MAELLRASLAGAVALATAWYLVQHLGVGALLWRHYRRHRALPFDEQRPLSVLVPARNEAANIGRCLAALGAQHYALPLDIVVGDDRSEDDTAAVVAAFLAQYRGPHRFRLVRIPGDYPGQRGKQNVLAHLYHHAAHDLLLVTDADIAVPPRWAGHLAAQFADAGTGMVSGPTAIAAGGGAFQALQRLDWLYGMASFHGFALAGFPVSAVGNNMAYTRAAYEAVGRYEHLPFSITEDYRLFRAIADAGYAVPFVFHPAVCNRSAPIRGLRTFLHQRKRWFRGGREAPFHAMLIFYVQAGTVPLLALGLALLPPALPLAALAVKLGTDAAFMGLAARILLPRRERAATLAWLPLHAAYLNLSVLLLPLYLLWPGRVVWKGRRI